MKKSVASDDLEVRVPQQSRSRKRFELILQEADKLLLEEGLSGFSIPELAKRLGFTRTSIYHFFPTPQAILNEVTRRYLKGLDDEFLAARAAATKVNWREAVLMIAEVVSNYYNAHPVGRMLILGMSASEESYHALAAAMDQIQRQIDVLMPAFGFRASSSNPNVAALTVEIGTACLRLSYHLHGEITKEYQKECARVMISYLENFIDEAGNEQAGR